QLFLGQGAAAQVGEWPLERLGQSLGPLAHLLGQSRGKLLEVFAQHLGFTQILLKNLGAVQVSKRTLKAQAVEGVKNTHDIFLVFLYKRFGTRAGAQLFFSMKRFYSINRLLSVHRARHGRQSTHSPIRWFAASWTVNSVAALPRRVTRKPEGLKLF